MVGGYCFIAFSLILTLAETFIAVRRFTTALARVALQPFWDTQGMRDPDQPLRIHLSASNPER